MIIFLSDEVKVHLRSGIAICSLQQCVEELVLNSIDAGATCVAVKVDVEACKLLVLDNGIGIDRQDFDKVGNRYSTSKCSSLKDLENLTYYGFRGEAVASIISLSDVVEISSRTKFSRKTFRKVFDNGQSKGVFEAETERPSAGTTVTVSNLFRNMPVRKKRLDPVLEMERIRQRVEAISLMHPSVSFTVMNECTGTMQVQLSKVKSTYYRFAQIHGLEKAKKLKEVTHLCGQFEITGHIGCEGHYNNNLQYLFLNRRLLLRTRIHKQLKFSLSKSTILNKPHSSPSVSQVTTFSLKESVGGQLYGVYVINISCSYSEYDICLEPAKTLVEFKDWDSLLLCLEEGVRMFLGREGLLRITPEDTQGCLSPPFACQRAAFSDVCENSKSPLGSDFVGGKALASKPVHRKVAANFTETSGDSKSCDKDVTESEVDDDVKLQLAMELASSDTVRALPPDADSSQVTSVSDTASQVKTNTCMTNSLLHRKKHEPSNCFPLFVESRALKTHTHSDCKSNKMRKISVATKLCSLKLAKTNKCDSTKDLLQQKIANSCRKKIRLAHSSTADMGYGEQVIDTLRQSVLFPNCNKDSSSTHRHSGHKFTETSDLTYSLFCTHHSGSSSTHNPSTKAQTTISEDLNNTHNLSIKGQPTTSEGLNMTNIFSIKGEPTSSKDINISHNLSEDFSVHTPSTGVSKDIFKNCEEIFLPLAASSEEHHTDETQKKDLQAPLFDSWLSHYDYVAGKVVYINKMTGLSKYDAPSEDVCVEGVRAHPVQAKAVLPFLFQSRTTRALSTGAADKADGEGTSDLAVPFSTWKNPVFIQPLDVGMNVTSGDVGRPPVRINSMMLPYRFTKDMIHSMKVIHQVDKKFLACLINSGNQGMSFYSKTEGCEANLLVLVDQHAAHERVRLEGLVAESYEDDPQQPSQKRLCSSVVSPPLEVDITQEDLRLLRSRQLFLGVLGLDVEFPPSDRPCVLLHKVPTCFLEKESTRLRRGRPSVVRSLIEVSMARFQTEVLVEDPLWSDP
ncbi:hypothetical protein ACEWY4_024277 [Coilia grayii]|uniref:MutL homolog 3 n=1 Tax=Coilia grayii TaxID=363190 RepID=A0ABD1J0V6_9TELE